MAEGIGGDTEQPRLWVPVGAQSQFHFLGSSQRGFLGLGPFTTFPQDTPDKEASPHLLRLHSPQ